MTEPGQLWVNVVDDEIIVTLPSSTYRGDVLQASRVVASKT